MTDESTAVDKPTGQQLEAVFFAALRARDFDGVIAALTVMTTVDVARASSLHDRLLEALGIAKMLDRIGTPDE